MAHQQVERVQFDSIAKMAELGETWGRLRAEGRADEADATELRYERLAARVAQISRRLRDGAAPHGE